MLKFDLKKSQSANKSLKNRSLRDVSCTKAEKVMKLFRPGEFNLTLISFGIQLLSMEVIPGFLNVVAL